jgi:hypothetical protein
MDPFLDNDLYDLFSFVILASLVTSQGRNFNLIDLTITCLLSVYAPMTARPIQELYDYLSDSGETIHNLCGKFFFAQHVQL